MTTKPAVTTAKTSVREYVQSDTFKNQIAQALPKHVSDDRFMRSLFTQVQKVPKLLQCSKGSLFSAAITCAQLGIEPDGRRAHLIPYGDNCQLIIDYKGLVELIMRGGSVSCIHADAICENDVFAYDKGTVREHRIDFRQPRGAAYAYYALVRFKDGAEKAEVMTVDEIEAIRKRSRSGGSGPWVTDFGEMAKKTAFRRLSKWIPLSPEVQAALNADDDVLDTRQPGAVIDVDDAFAPAEKTEPKTEGGEK